ncbi:zinc ribbon domain-containing protein [Halovivax sp.]|nr:zinc ribbon domain-containing protein [Halovivax sp.]
MDDYQFTCPECRRELPLDGPLCEATIEHGCPVCGAEVSRRHFPSP